MTRPRTTLVLASAALVAAALVSPAGPAAAGTTSSTATVAAALPPLGPGDWTGARNKPAGGGWNQAETTIVPASAASLHVARSLPPGAVPGYGGESVATGHGLVYTASPGGGLAAYDEQTGAPRWSAPVGGKQVVVGDQAIYTVTGGGDTPVGGFAGVTAYAAGTGALLWQKAIPKLLASAPPTLVGSRVLVAWNAKAGKLGPSYVAAYNATTGRQLWQRKLPQAAAATWPYLVSSVSAEGGTGVVTIAGGSAFAFDLTSGALRWQLDEGGLTGMPSMSRPIIRDGVVYLNLLIDTEHGVVEARRLTSGAAMWSRAFSGMPSGMAEANGVLYLGLDVEGLPSTTPDVYALRTDDGSTVWSRVIGSSAVPPTVAGGLVYVTPVIGSDRQLALSAATGAVLSSVELAGVVNAEAVVSHGRVYVSTDHGMVGSSNTDVVQILTP